MIDIAATWLRRALSVTSLVLLSSALGCGGEDRVFVPDTTRDASPDAPAPGTDVSPDVDATPDVSMGTQDGGDGPAPVDTRDAVSDVAADGTTDTSKDVALDVALDVTLDVALDVTPDIALDAAPDAADAPLDTPVDANADVDNQPPTIVSTIPADMATAVAVTTTITVDFSKPMNPSTVGLSLNPTTTLGSAIWNGAYTSVAFSPPTPLAAMASYAATVTGSDTAGRALTGPTSFSFGTGAGADKTPPTIRATVPADNAMDVPAGTSIIVTFSEPMDVGTVTLSPAPDMQLGLPTFNPQNNEISFAPSPLRPFTEYTITVAGQDPAGNPLAPSTSFKFTTAKPPDTTPPTVVAIAPPDGATAVPSNSSIVITFSEAMNVQATTAALSVSPAVTCIGGWGWNQTSTTTTCVPATPLAFSTLHTVGVGVGAKDIAGNALAAAYASSFTTGVMPDQKPPSIVSVVPADGATGVSRSAKIVVNFSEAMDVTATQAAFSITSPAGHAGTISWGSGNTQMVFTPSAPYPYGATVKWQVSTAAKDASGNAKTTLDAYSFEVIKVATTKFQCISALDGYVNSLMAAYATNNFIVFGCSGGNTLRGMTAFDISTLPATTSLIISAAIYVQQYNVQGTPYGSAALGNALWRHVDFGGTLDGADYNAALLAHAGNSGTLSTDLTSEFKSSIVTLSVRDDFTNRMTRGNRSEFMLRFTQDNMTGCTTAYAYFHACEATAPDNRPYLSVTYEYP